MPLPLATDLNLNVALDDILRYTQHQYALKYVSKLLINYNLLRADRNEHRSLMRESTIDFIFDRCCKMLYRQLIATAAISVILKMHKYEYCICSLKMKHSHVRQPNRLQQVGHQQQRQQQQKAVS